MGEGILIDTAGVDCCCEPPPVIIVCPPFIDLETCGTMKTMSATGIEVQFVDGQGNGCVTAWSLSYPVVLSGGGQTGSWGYVGGGVGGWSTTLAATLGNADCSNIGSNGEGSGVVGCSPGPPLQWVAFFAPNGLLAGDQFRYGNTQPNACPGGPWSYGPISPDPMIVGLAPPLGGNSNPGVVATGSVTIT